MTNKNSVKFKVGDLVYCPSLERKVLNIKKMDNGKITLNVHNITNIFSDGKGIFGMPVIFHATQQNYELLSKLYPNVAFEPPPKRKEPKEIIYDMLNNGYDVVNYIADGTFGFFSKHNIANITYREFNNFVYTRFINDCKDFKVITQKGKTIIDFVDGEVVLESENDIS